MADFFATTGVDNITGSGDNDYIYITPDQVQAGDHFGGDYGLDTLVLSSNLAYAYWDFTAVTFSDVEVLAFTGASSANTQVVNVYANDVDDGNYAEPFGVVGSSGVDIVTITLSAQRIFYASPINFMNWTDGVDHLTLEGSSGGDWLGGTSYGDVLNGNAGADTLDGGPGADTMSGGTEDDTYYVDNVGDVVIENPGEGGDVVFTTISYTLPDNVEYLGLSGTDPLSGTGNGLNNIVVGNSANNILDGKAGADTLRGGAGDDTYYVDSASDVVDESAAYSGAGTDTVHATFSYTLGANLENLVLDGSSAINGTGNSADNSITGNSAANVLDGATGADTMAGGAGDDTYYVDNAGDVVTENASEGTDTVHASVDYTLTANVENLVLEGAALNGTGNDLGNSITGNSGANVLDGGAGADTLIGGAGDDTYYVDNASDVVTENAGEGTDTVHASASYTLSSEVENLVLDGSSAINGTGNGLANSITGNAGNNTLDGGAGADTLVGG